MDYRPYELRDLAGILALCEAEEWPSWPADPRRAHRVLTNPGVTAVVAVQAGRVTGFVHLLSDGEIQAYITMVAVAAGCRGKGIGRRLIAEAFALCGAQRADLLSEADGFYEQFAHRRLPGYRLYPPFGT